MMALWTPYTSMTLLLAVLSICTCTIAAIVSGPGQIAIIPNWRVQSMTKAGNDAAKLSATDLDTSSWYFIGSKATLMGTLLENRVFDERDLFFSANLQDVDDSQFRVPWLYRSEFELKKSNTSYFQLKTNGISSRADIWLNGKQVTNKDTHAGAYVGLTFDITAHAKEGRNILLVRAYPTDYNKDLALGFVDWNPNPPDNGTGIWRDVEIKQTGLVAITTPRVITTLNSYQTRSNITFKLEVQNLEARAVKGYVTCTLSDPLGKEQGSLRADFKVNGKLQHTVTLNTTITQPQVWWPKLWGAQPLYSVQCNASTGDGLSDSTPKTRFGIRTVTSTLDKWNATVFYINEKRFQVVGAGYTSDIFLRFSEPKLRTQFAYMLDMGLNTVRLEGKQEHAFLYDLADELGLMVMPGWECCDKWEGWAYNDEGSGTKWSDADYAIANNSMRHEAALMQPHPSILAFLIGSDFWPDDRATSIYVAALRALDWPTPIIASASQRGFPALLGNGGMKMEGPYDWVPPAYWFDSGHRLGSAWGFASELSAGAGTPSLSSLQTFLSPSDLTDLWTAPNKSLYHMSTAASQFHSRELYSNALFARYGAPASLEDYILRCQMADYEATRAQFEAYASRWTAEPAATGLVYWMLNNAWPSLHWNLFDFYLRTGGAYYGAKTGARTEHAVYDPATSTIWLVNRSLDRAGPRTVDLELIAINGTVLGSTTMQVATEPNSSRDVGTVGLVEGAGLARLVLRDGAEVLSRNVYWLSENQDVLDWDASTWYYTPTTQFADFTALDRLQRAEVEVGVRGGGTVRLVNRSPVPAVFVRLNLVDGEGEDVVPAMWSDNYVTLWPEETLDLRVEYSGGASGTRIQVSGKNVDALTVDI